MSDSAPFRRQVSGDTGAKFTSKPKPLNIPENDPWSLPAAAQSSAAVHAAAPSKSSTEESERPKRTAATKKPKIGSGAPLWAYAAVSIDTPGAVRELSRRRKCRLSDIVITAVGEYTPTDEVTVVDDDLPLEGSRQVGTKMREQYRVTPAQHKWLEQRVNEAEMPMTQLVGRALDAYVASQPDTSQK